MSKNLYIDPTDTERVLWRHSGSRPVPKKPPTEKQIKLAGKLNWAFRVLMVLFAIYYFSRPENLEYLSSRAGLTFIVVWFLFLAIVPRLIEFFTRCFKSEEIPVLISLPIWMSEDRLIYTADGWGAEQELVLSDILQSRLDYEMGSLALVIKSSKATIKLMSSEIKNLQTKLYTLRPELEPSS